MTTAKELRMSSDEMGRETFGFLIEVALTSEELAKNDARNAEVDIQIRDIKGQRAESNNRFKELLTGLTKEQTGLLERRSTGKAKVEIPCYQERDDRRGMMLTRRNDNGDIVDERALTAEERNESGDERQGNLFEGGARAPDPDAGDDDGDGQPSDADADAALDEYIAQSGSADSDDDDDGAGEAAPIN
jgi:hypothetical protein